MRKKGRRSIGIIAGALGLLLAHIWITPGPRPLSDRSTTLILVRHAEKARDGSPDPPLTPAGRRRAGELAHALGHLDLTAVYATPFRRTRQTAEPVASSRNLEILSYAAEDTDFAKKAAADHVGGAVLIVGHSNTIPRLVNRLIGREDYAQLADSVYDNLFIVMVAEDGKAEVIRLRFGDPTPEDISKSGKRGPATEGRPYRMRSRVETGLDVLRDTGFESLRGRRVGIITNPTGIARDGRHIIDLLSEAGIIDVTALFAPEHGIRGDRADAVPLESGVDRRTGARIWSLYGDHLQPTPDMLAEVDVLVYDIQDVGARFYTFISTMGLAMQAAARHGKAFLVLDRPGPINGLTVEGPVLERDLASFVGRYPLPIRYGMTPGETARMIKGEGWLEGLEELDLSVIPMRGWRRTMWYDETGLPWIKPSPNIPDLRTAAVYPGMCLVEALNLSEGRGTMRPFEICGAPWIDAEALAEAMNSIGLEGVRFKPIDFIPTAIPNADPNPKYRDRLVHGLELVVTDRRALRPTAVMVHLMTTLRRLYPEQLELRAYLERLIGTASFRGDIISGRDPGEILREWEAESKEFLHTREKYLIYE